MLWIVTALSKANAVWNVMAAHWRITLGVIVLLAVMLSGALLDRKLFWPNPLKAQNDALIERINGENRSHSIGLDLANGNNQYEADTYAIKTPVDGAIVDDASRMRIQARITAGKRSRASLGKVQ